mgnify:CR=1 FL=1
MAFTDLIKPGDKIDIRLLQQVENEERTGDTVKVYKSQVLDINKRGNLEISMLQREQTDSSSSGCTFGICFLFRRILI